MSCVGIFKSIRGCSIRGEAPLVEGIVSISMGIGENYSYRLST